MTTMIETSKRIRIVAPDARSAMALERRLAHFRPVAIGRGPEWHVELEDWDDQLAEITAAVEHWLREIGAAETEMHVDGTVVTVGKRADDDAPLGAGYDGAHVLEHEP